MRRLLTRNPQSGSGERQKLPCSFPFPLNSLHGIGPSSWIKQIWEHPHIPRAFSLHWLVVEPGLPSKTASIFTSAVPPCKRSRAGLMTISSWRAGRTTGLTPENSPAPLSHLYALGLWGQCWSAQTVVDYRSYLKKIIYIYMSTGKLSLTPGWALPSAAYSSKRPSLMFYKSVQRTHWFPRLNFGGLFYTGLLLGPSKKGVDIGFMAPGKEFSKYDSRFCQVENINHHRSYNLSRWISCRYEL